MDVDIDTEKTNPFGSGVDNPGDNEDIETTPNDDKIKIKTARHARFNKTKTAQNL